MKTRDSNREHVFDLARMRSERFGAPNQETPKKGQIRNILSHFFGALPEHTKDNHITVLVTIFTILFGASPRRHIGLIHTRCVAVQVRARGLRRSTLQLAQRHNARVTSAHRPWRDTRFRLTCLTWTSLSRRRRVTLWRQRRCLTSWSCRRPAASPGTPCNTQRHSVKQTRTVLKTRG